MILTPCRQTYLTNFYFTQVNDFGKHLSNCIDTSDSELLYSAFKVHANKMECKYVNICMFCSSLFHRSIISSIVCCYFAI